MHTEAPTYVMFSSQEDGRAPVCSARYEKSTEPCLLDVSLSEATLDSIAATTNVHAIGDTVVFAVHAPGVKSVQAMGGITVDLARRETGDLWSAAVLVPNAANVIISYRFITDTMATVPARREFRGEQAPAALLRSAQLHGSIRIDTLASAALGAREIVSYIPPGPTPKKPFDVVYVADGAMVREFAPLLDTLIVDGHLPPTVLVGVRATREVPGDPNSHLRAREYVYGFDSDSARFLAHETFFMDDVAIWAEKALHVSAQRGARTIWGASNGGAFAIAMGLRHPDRFAHVIASAPVYAQIPPAKDGAPLPTFYLTAGTLEQTTRARTVVLSDALKKIGARTRVEVTGGGHDELVWAEWFIRGLIAG